MIGNKRFNLKPGRIKDCIVEQKNIEKYRHMLKVSPKDLQKPSSTHGGFSNLSQKLGWGGAVGFDERSKWLLRLERRVGLLH